MLGHTLAGAPGFDGVDPTQVATNLNGGLGSFGFGSDDTDDTRPYAYLNYVLFRDDYTVVDAGWRRVPPEAGFDPGEEGLPGLHQRLAFDDPVVAGENGYLYVWVSNESENTEVWFDDLKVTHTGVFVAQATDYGAWGDVLREQRTDERKYRYGYQGQFAERDEETGWNHFELREYDAVVGRWMVKDPAGQYFSSYLGMGNNPINGLDPDGAFSEYVNAVTGERVSIDDGIDVVTVIEGENWANFMDYYNATEFMGTAQARFGILSRHGDNYLIGPMLDFYNGYKNPGRWEYGTNLLKENNVIFINSDPNTHFTDQDPWGVRIWSTGDPRERGAAHMHYNPLGSVEGLSDKDLRHAGYGIYNVVISPHNVYFYNRYRTQVSNFGNSRLVQSGMNFVIPRSAFNK